MSASVRASIGAATGLLGLLGCSPAQGLRCHGPAVAGGSVSVDVGGNDSTVEVTAAGSAATTSHAVGPDKRASVPVPVVPPGTLLVIHVGRGARARVLIVEVVAP